MDYLCGVLQLQGLEHLSVFSFSTSFLFGCAMQVLCAVLFCDLGLIGESNFILVDS